MPNFNCDFLAKEPKIKIPNESWEFQMIFFSINENFFVEMPYQRVKTDYNLSIYLFLYFFKMLFLNLFKIDKNRVLVRKWT